MLLLEAELVFDDDGPASGSCSSSVSKCPCDGERQGVSACQLHAPWLSRNCSHILADAVSNCSERRTPGGMSQLDKHEASPSSESATRMRSAQISHALTSRELTSWVAKAEGLRQGRKRNAKRARKSANERARPSEQGRAHTWQTSCCRSRRQTSCWPCLAVPLSLSVSACASY